MQTPLIDARPTIHFPVRVSPRQADQLRAIAAASGATVSETVRRLLDAGAEEWTRRQRRA